MVKIHNNENDYNYCGYDSIIPLELENRRRTVVVRTVVGRTVVELASSSSKFEAQTHEKFSDHLAVFISVKVSVEKLDYIFVNFELTLISGFKLR